MGFEVIPSDDASRVRLFIDYGGAAMSELIWLSESLSKNII